MVSSNDAPGDHSSQRQDNIISMQQRTSPSANAEEPPPAQQAVASAHAMRERQKVILTKEMRANGGGDHHARHALRAVVMAMVYNVLIASSKLLVASFVTRSAALFSEGLHSAADAFNSLTLLFGILQGKKAPDRTHPYGYGLETNFWALIASVVLFGSAAASLFMGWQRLSQPEPLHDVGWAIALLALSVVFEIGAISAAASAVLYETGHSVSRNPFTRMLSAYRHVGKVQSPTTRFVFYEDLVALLGALIALTALLISVGAVHWHWLPAAYGHVPDAVASMMIGLMLLGLAINLFSYNRSFLTGAAASETTENAIERLVLETAGITSIVDLRTIDQGLSGLFIQLKVEVEPDIPVRDVDDRIEHLKDRLFNRVPNAKEVFVEVLANEVDQVWGEAFKALVQEGVTQSLLQPREAVILHNVLEFTESTVSEVMIPRTDVVSVAIDTPLLEVAEVILESRHSKIPVFRERVDQLAGMIHAREVFGLIMADRAETPVEAILRDITIYPENKRVSDLLEEFKRNKLQMAAVLDEHGGFAGVVTVADLMEELVGELWDDDDEVEEPIEMVRLTPHELRVSGRASSYDVNERFGLAIPCDDFNTVGGFVFGLLGREPETGDEVRYEDYTFRVTEMDGPRVKLVTILVDTAMPAPLAQDEPGLSS